jgi:hypothetical protein
VSALPSLHSELDLHLTAHEEQYADAVFGLTHVSFVPGSLSLQFADEMHLGCRHAEFDLPGLSHISIVSGLSSSQSNLFEHAGV